MSDPYSIIALCIAITSGCFVFINNIKKCRYNRKDGLEIDRTNDENNVDKTQEFTLELVKTLQHSNHVSPRKCSSDDAIARNLKIEDMKYVAHLPLNISLQNNGTVGESSKMNKIIVSKTKANARKPYIEIVK